MIVNTMDDYMTIISLESNEKNERRIQNLDKIIYFLCFDQPRYVSEISKLLYGLKSEINRTYLSGKKLPELIEKGWIEKIPKEKTSNIIAKKNRDGRNKARIYYKASSDSIISKIKKTTELDDFEEFVLRNMIDSPFFRNFVVNSLPSDPKSFNSDPFEYIISLLDIILIEVDENIGLRELNIQLSLGIKSKKQYNRLKRNIKKVMREKLPELSGVYFDKGENKDKKGIINFVGGRKLKSSQEKSSFIYENSSEWIEQILIFLIIPDILFNKIMTISNFGATYFVLKRQFKEYSALGDFYLEKLSLK